MSAVNEKPLDALLGERPASLALANIALTAWPEHDKFLIRSFRQRSSEVLDATEIVSTAILKLIDGDERRFGEDYRWTCDRLREEEIFFHREGRYRLSTFADAYAEVYSNHEYMRRYVGGLLLTQALWFNHVATMEMFLSRVLGATTGPFDYLEIGPGHGLMTYFAAESKLARSLEAWDVSSVSLEETKAALGKLGVPKPVALVETDILQVGAARRRFDLVVMSEVLEHSGGAGDGASLPAFSDRGWRAHLPQRPNQQSLARPSLPLHLPGRRRRRDRGVRASRRTDRTVRDPGETGRDRPGSAHQRFGGRHRAASLREGALTAPSVWGRARRGPGAFAPRDENIECLTEQEGRGLLERNLIRSGRALRARARRERTVASPPEGVADAIGQDRPERVRRAPTPRRSD